MKRSGFFPPSGACVCDRRGGVPGAGSVSGGGMMALLQDISHCFGVRLDTRRGGRFCDDEAGIVPCRSGPHAGNSG
jgi:hypothetical protein